MKFITYCSLFILLCLTACKKSGNNTPEPPPVPRDVPYWHTVQLTMKNTDREFFKMVGTPDSFFHMTQWSFLSAHKLTWFPVDQYFSLLEKGCWKYYETREHNSELRYIAPGKDNELYVLPFDSYKYNTKVLRLNKEYTGHENLGTEMNVDLLPYGTLIEYSALATDKNGDLYVAALMNKNFSGQSGRESCILQRKYKERTSTITSIPGYPQERVFKIVVDDDGLLYVMMTYGDVLCYNAGSASWKVLYKNTADKVVRDFTCAGSGNIYVASTNGLFLSKDQGTSVVALPTPSDVTYPAFQNVHVNKNGTIYTTVDTIYVRRPDYSVSNCYYSTDKGNTWKHVKARGNGTSRMTIQGFDVAGRLLATFTDTTSVPRSCCINAKHILYGLTTNPVE